MKSNEKILAAMSFIDEDIIAEANIIKKPISFKFKSLSAIAASLVLIVGSFFILRFVLSDGITGSGGNSAAPEGSAPEFDYEDSEGNHEEDEEEEEDTDEADKEQNQ